MEFEPSSNNNNYAEYEDDELFMDEYENYQPYRVDTPCSFCMYYQYPVGYDQYYWRNTFPSRQYPVDIGLENCNIQQKSCVVVIRVAGQQVVKVPVRLENNCIKANGEASAGAIKVGVDGEICVNVRKREVCFVGVVYTRYRVLTGCPRKCRWVWKRQNVGRVTQCTKYM